MNDKNMKKDGTEYLALVRYSESGKTGWHVIKWAWPAMRNDPSTKEQWCVSVGLGLKIDKIIKAKELSEIIKYV